MEGGSARLPDVFKFTPLTKPMILLMLQGMVGLPWDKLLYGAQGVLVLGMILYGVIKVLPSWERVKDREFTQRQTEVTVRGEEAKALTKLADVLREVAVEQRKATDKTAETAEMIEMLQRVNADSANRLERNVAAVNDRIDRVETLIANQTSLTARVGALEHSHASGPQSAAA